LKDDENDGSNNRDEVEGQVDDVADERRDAKLVKGALEDAPEARHGVAAGLDLAALAHHGGVVAGDEGAVEGVEERLLEEPVAGNNVDNGGGLVEDDQHGGEDGERAVDEDEDGKLRQVGEGKHAADDGHGETDVRGEAGGEGLPQRAMGEEVEYPL